MQEKIRRCAKILRVVWRTDTQALLGERRHVTPELANAETSA
jgi:hypothetical protein